jgi:hypothetical protein
MKQICRAAVVLAILGVVGRAFARDEKLPAPGLPCRRANVFRCAHTLLSFEEFRQEVLEKLFSQEWLERYRSVLERLEHPGSQQQNAVMAKALAEWRARQPPREEAEACGEGAIQGAEALVELRRRVERTYQGADGFSLKFSPASVAVLCKGMSFDHPYHVEQRGEPLRVLIFTLAGGLGPGWQENVHPTPDRRLR